MTFTTACPNCGLALSATNEQVGKQGKCSGCGSVFTIEMPRPVGMPVAAPAAPMWPQGATGATYGQPGSTRVGEGISRGFTVLHSNIGVFLLIGLCFFLINLGLGFVGAIPCIGPVLSLISAFVIQPALICGFYQAALKQHDGWQADIGDLFGVFHLWVDYILLILIQMVIGVAIFIPGGAILFASFTPMMFQGQQEPNLPVFVAAIIILVLSGLFVGLAFVFSYVALVDRRQGFWDAISTSWRLMLSNPFGTLGMVLFVALCSVAGFCLFCIGILYAAPLIHCVIASVYRTAVPRSVGVQPMGVAPVWSSPPAAGGPYSPPPPPPGSIPPQPPAGI